MTDNKVHAGMIAVIVAGCRLRRQLVLSRLQLQYSPWYPPNELRNGLLVQKSKKTNYKLILL